MLSNQEKQPLLNQKIQNNIDIIYNDRLNFSTLEFNYLMEYCGFTTLEKNIFKMRQNGRSNVDISVVLNISISSVNRSVRAIKGKVRRCIAQFYKIKQK